MPQAAAKGFGVAVGAGVGVAGLVGGVAAPPPPQARDPAMAIAATNRIARRFDHAS